MRGGNPFSQPGVAGMIGTSAMRGGNPIRHKQPQVGVGTSAMRGGNPHYILNASDAAGTSAMRGGNPDSGKDTLLQWVLPQCVGETQMESARWPGC